MHSMYASIAQVNAARKANLHTSMDVPKDGKPNVLSYSTSTQSQQLLEKGKARKLNMINNRPKMTSPDRVNRAIPKLGKEKTMLKLQGSVCSKYIVPTAGNLPVINDVSGAAAQFYNNRSTANLSQADGMSRSSAERNFVVIE